MHVPPQRPAHQQREALTSAAIDQDDLGTARAAVVLAAEACIAGHPSAADTPHRKGDRHEEDPRLRRFRLAAHAYAQALRASRAPLEAAVLEMQDLLPRQGAAAKTAELLMNAAVLFAVNAYLGDG